MQRKQGIYEKYIKRLIDVIVSLTVMLLFWWLFLILVILVRIKLGSPALFKQARPGKNEKIFYMYKFRSMTDERDENGQLLPDDMRLTKFGRLLRSTSLDELPELFNILKGDMSIVGPRPLLVEYLPYYTEEESHRHDVLPGLTGLAQVNGRNAIDWDTKLAYDVEYVKEITFINDMKILVKTVSKVIKRSDIQVGKDFKAGKFIDQRKARMKQDKCEI